MPADHSERAALALAAREQLLAALDTSRETRLDARKLTESQLTRVRQLLELGRQ